MSESQTSLLNSPYGVVSYESFRKQKRAIADKSGIIKHLDDIRMTKYPVLLRPRVFGKSAFVQMLKCFYDISYTDKYEELFSGTEVYKEHLERHNTYHVLEFDFSGISGLNEGTLKSSFFIAVKSGINDFMVRYPDFTFTPTDAETETPAGYFTAFVNAYRRYPGKQSLYLMIDEYDNFVTSLLSRDLELFRAITSSSGFLKDFYAAVKEGTKKYVAKTFITGVSSVSLGSLTSGFNNVLNVTSYKCFNEYAGFTEEELKRLITQLIDLKAVGTTADELISIMKPVYDGYCFSSGSPNTIYNPSLCLYYLYKVSRIAVILPPENYLGPAFDHVCSKLQQLLAIAEEGLADRIFESYLTSSSFSITNLAENINLSKSAQYNEGQLLSMLYYRGYLTIDPLLSTSSRLTLKIPNIYVSRLFAQCAVDMRLKPSRHFKEQALDISSLLDGSDDISSFASSCTEFLSGIFTNQVLSPMNELALNLVLQAKLDSIFGVFAEMQKSLRIVGIGENYADLVVTVNIGAENECTYLFELKYTHENKATEEKISSLKAEAQGLVHSYKTAIEFRDKTVRPFVMIFAGSTCVYCGH